MNTESVRTCPKCAAPIPPEAPQGLCPKCVLAAVTAGTEAGPQPEQPPVLPALESIAAGFPQLEILEFIGQGGMGLVFKARQRKLDRFVALKLLPQKPRADPAFCERLTSLNAMALGRVESISTAPADQVAEYQRICALIHQLSAREQTLLLTFTPQASFVKRIHEDLSDATRVKAQLELDHPELATKVIPQTDAGSDASKQQ